MCIFAVRVPCEQTFVVYFEHVRQRPWEYVGPLSEFLELSDDQQEVVGNLFAVHMVNGGLLIFSFTQKLNKKVLNINSKKAPEESTKKAGKNKKPLGGSRPVGRKAKYRYTHLSECRGVASEKCTNTVIFIVSVVVVCLTDYVVWKVWSSINNFFLSRKYMWPTFSGDGNRASE